MLAETGSQTCGEIEMEKWYLKKIKNKNVNKKYIFFINIFFNI